MNRREEPLKILLIGLSGDHTPSCLEKFFSKSFQSILRVKIRKRSKKSNKVEGVGTLLLTDQSDRDNILSRGSFHLKGRKFHAKPFLKGKELRDFQNKVKMRRVFINFIPRQVDNQALKRAFLRFG